MYPCARREVMWGGDVDACLHSFLTSLLRGGRQSASPQVKEFTVPVEKEVGLSFLEKTKIFCLRWDSKHDSSVVHSVAWSLHRLWCPVSFQKALELINLFKFKYFFN
jgi:hypothetical protein